MRWLLAFALAGVGCGGSLKGGHTPPARNDVAGRTVIAETRVVSRGVELFVRAVGPATAPVTVLVLHGGPGYSHEYLRAMELAASSSVRVVFYDQRGVGRSTAPMVREGGEGEEPRIDLRPEQWNFAAHRTDIEALRDHLGAQRLHLVGFSWGGMVAMDYAVHHPQQVASLALVASGEVASGDPHRAFRVRYRELVKARLIVPDLIGVRTCNEAADAIAPVYFANPRHPAVGRPTGSVCSSWIVPETFRAIGSYDFRPALAHLRVPTLVFHGEKDYAVPWEAAVVTAKSFISARARLVLQPDCGHRVIEECRPALFRELESLWRTPGLYARANEPVPAVDEMVFEANRQRVRERDRLYEATSAEQDR